MATSAHGENVRHPSIIRCGEFKCGNLGMSRSIFKDFLSSLHTAMKKSVTEYTFCMFQPIYMYIYCKIFLTQQMVIYKFNFIEEN